MERNALPASENDASARLITARLNDSLLGLERNGSSTAKADEFQAFLSRPGTLKRASHIVRCRFDGNSIEIDVVVDKPYSRRRVADGLQPCLKRIRKGLKGAFDVFILISDMIYVEEDARAEYLRFLAHVPFLRCDWLENDPISSNALIMPDLWLQEDVYGSEIKVIDDLASVVPFKQRQSIVKWRGGLSGPGYPDIDNCRGFPRYHLLLQSLRHPDIVDARLTHYENIPATPAGDALQAQLNDWFGGVAPFVPIEDFTAYKYLVSFDGVAASWKRVATILWTGSVLLLQHQWQQFFYPGLTEWEHYVPIADDASDLPDRFEWLETNPGRAEAIAEAGRSFARQNLTQSAVDRYMCDLLNRCSQLL